MNENDLTTIFHDDNCRESLKSVLKLYDVYG
jgi:hypothetical protein